MGDWASKPSCLFGMAWEEEMSNYLGVNLNQSVAVKNRWKPKLSAAERKLQPWRNRNIALFTRAHVCNAIAYPAVLYGARITSIDADTLNRLHRSWAVFLWRSTFEPMRRSNLFWSLEKGGFGLVNAELKLTIQRFLYFLGLRDPFLVAATQCLGTRHLAPWLATTASLCFDTRGTRFYKEIALALAMLEQHFSWDYLLKTKPRKLYWDLVEKVLPPPLYRQPPIPNDVLKRVRRLPLPTASKDFFFRLHMGVLPAKARLEDKGFFLHGGAGCLLCGKRETAEHVLTYYNAAAVFWDELQTAYTGRWDLAWSDLRHLSAPTENKALRDCVLVLGLHSLWRARVDAVECARNPRPTWRHFTAKAEWTVSVLGASDSDTELRDSLQKGCQALQRFKEKEMQRWQWL